MANWIQYLIPPIIGAGVGYFTNDIAVRMLFHPIEPVYLWGKKLPFTPGLVPAEQARLAEKISALIVETLLTREDFQHLARQLLTNDRLGQAINRSVDALLEEMGQPEKLELLSEDMGGALSNLIERSLPSLIDHLSHKSLTPERIRHVLDRIMDSVLENFKVTPAMAAFLSQRIMASVLTPEHVRVSLISLLTPSNIAALDELAKAKMTGRYAVVLFFLNLPDVLSKLRHFLESDPERSNEMLDEVLSMMRLDDVISRALLRFNPREMSWEDLNHFKENLVLWIHDYLIHHYEVIIPPLVEKMDLPALVKDLIRRFHPQDIPPATVESIKREITRFLERYLDEKLFELVEQALEVADIQGVIATKIRNFSPLRMEAIIMEVSRKELGMIVSLGGILGFVIGVLQSGLMLLMGG
jgi:uncharacterized membrane protein YheB (UPF0754 family)